MSDDYCFPTDYGEKCVPKDAILRKNKKGKYEYSYDYREWYPAFEKPSDTSYQPPIEYYNEYEPRYMEKQPRIIKIWSIIVPLMVLGMMFSVFSSFTLFNDGDWIMFIARIVSSILSFIIGYVVLKVLNVDDITLVIYDNRTQFHWGDSYTENYE